MQPYLYDTLYYLYLFWFKPLTLHHQLNELAGDPLLLRTSLFALLRQPQLREALMKRSKLWHVIGQIVLGNFLLLVIGTMLLGWLSDISGLTLLMGGTQQTYWARVAFNVAFGMAFGMIFGLVFDVAFGLAFGVVLGVMLGVGGGVAEGIAFGMALGMAGAVVQGVRRGEVVGLAQGLAKGIALCVAIGVVLGIVLNLRPGKLVDMARELIENKSKRNVISGLVKVLFFSEPLDRIFGVNIGMIEGMAGGLAIILTYFRLPLAPLWIIWSFLQWWLVEQGVGNKKEAFSYSAIQLDELIYVPLPLFDRLLMRCMEAAPAEAANMLAQTAQSTGQKWAVTNAAMYWAAQGGAVAISLPELVKVAERYDAAADILVNMSSKHEKVGNLLRDLAAVAYSLANIGQVHTAAAALKVLERNQIELNSLRIKAGLLKRNELAEMAEHWQRLIRTHAQQLEKAPRMVLTGAYQAGSALEVGSSLFRGRRDMFALTDEVYANPHRAETLLLIAQQRMGKSSALMQLPAQLPDAHVVIVDCQRAIAGKGDELFAVGISAAIQTWEKRRPGGLHQVPLELEDVKKQPLHQLNRWLERYADRARRKRILLCLDEFDKLVRFVAEGRLSEDVLAFLRGLSQDTGWMLLYSGQFELDDWAPKYAEYLKNVRRVRISYLQPDEARSLLEHPVPDFALTWHPDATDAVLHWTGCQPFLIQMMGTQVTNRLADTTRRHVSAEDIDAIIPEMFDSGRYYFQSLHGAFSLAEQQALHDIAHTGHSNVALNALHRLVDHEYIHKSEEKGWAFRVPLLREWYRRAIG